MVVAIDMRGRRGRPWRRLCAEVYSTETHCWLCGEWVDQALRFPSKRRRSVDHVIPLSLGGPPLARHNVRLAHLDCNCRRGDGTKRRPELGQVSEAW